MTSLENKRVVVTGVTGNVGWGIAKALLNEGANVIAIARKHSAVEAIATSLGNSNNLNVEIGDLSNSNSTVMLRDRIVGDGPIDHMVAAIGPWWQKGKTVEQPLAEYAEVRSTLLDPHVYAAMAFVPVLRDREGSSYTIITGAAAHMELLGTGLLVVAVSGVVALSRMLRNEHAHDKLRINEVMIKTRIEKETREGVTHAPIFGKEIVNMIAGPVRGKVMEYDGIQLKQT